MPPPDAVRATEVTRIRPPQARVGQGDRKGVPMQIDKDTVLSMIRERGDEEQASRAERELPDQVDTDRDAGMLEQFGVSPGELMSRFSGGRDIPGL